MIGVKPMQPPGAWYLEAIGTVERLFTVLRESLKIGKSSPNRYHTRGDYLRFAFGVSHGGGQKVRVNIAALQWR